jgi:hypothetical protein
MNCIVAIFFNPEWQAERATVQFAKIAALPSFENFVYICSRVARREESESRNFGKLPVVRRH